MKVIKGGLNQDAQPSTFKNAQFLRDRMTRQEQLIWEQIRHNQIHRQRFRRQHPIGIYVLDFVCIKCKLSIEVDGESHNVPNQIEYDMERTKYLIDLGIKEIRFKNEEVDRDLDGVIEIIKEVVKSRLK